MNTATTLKLITKVTHYLVHQRECLIFDQQGPTDSKHKQVKLLTFLYHIQLDPLMGLIVKALYQWDACACELREL